MTDNGATPVSTSTPTVVARYGHARDSYSGAAVKLAHKSSCACARHTYCRTIESFLLQPGDSCSAVCRRVTPKSTSTSNINLQSETRPYFDGSILSAGLPMMGAVVTRFACTSIHRNSAKLYATEPSQPRLVQFGDFGSFNNMTYSNHCPSQTPPSSEFRARSVVLSAELAATNQSRFGRGALVQMNTRGVFSRVVKAGKQQKAQHSAFSDIYTDSCFVQVVTRRYLQSSLIMCAINGIAKGSRAQ